MKHSHTLTPEQVALSELMLNLRRLKQAQRLVRNAHRDNEDNRQTVQANPDVPGTGIVTTY